MVVISYGSHFKGIISMKDSLIVDGLKAILKILFLWNMEWKRSPFY